MKKYVIFVFIFIFAMISILTGCSEEKYEEIEEVPVIHIGISEKSGISQDFSEVNEKLGELTEEKIGVRAQLVWTGLSSQNSYYKNRQLEVEITNTYFSGYQKYKEKNLLLNLEEYLPEAPALQKVLEEKAALASWNQGGVYAIPKPTSDIHSDGVILNRNYVEKYNMDLSSIHEPEDLEPFFEIIKEKEPKVIPWALEKSGNAVIERAAVGDILDGSMSCLIYGEDGYQVCNFYESKAYENQVMRAEHWQERGYLAKDVLTEAETGKNQVIAGTAFATECVIRPDENQYDESIYGENIVIKEFDGRPALDTESDWVLVWCIFAETEYPKEAVQVLNLLYEDEEVLNLILYGIEGKHYEVIEDGSFVYPEGVTTENVTYANNSKWKYNIPKAGIWQGMSETLEEDMENLKNSAQISKAYGFWLDEDRISVNLDKIREITAAYTPKLETGMCDTKNYLARFRQELREAGAAQLVKEVQQQLDEWRKAEKEH